MRYVLGVVLFSGLLASIWFVLASPDTKSATPASAPATSTEVPPPPTQSIAPPDTIVFENDYGRSVFTHKQHIERVNGDCGVCHPKIFPQSRTALKYGKAKHRAAEASGTDCAACHRVGGTSFAADSNCTKCHEVKQ